MKNAKSIILGGAAIAVLSAGVYSFTSDTNPTTPELKNYEVIRMVDGQMTTYDTTLSAASTYSPSDYLADLGFSNDAQINIIDLTHPGGDNEFTFSSEEHNLGDGQVMIIEMDENSEDVQTTTNPDGTQEIRIEKTITKSSENGEEDVNVEVMLDGDMENINMDSLIAVAMAGHQSDSGQVIIHRMIVTDEHHDGNGAVEWEDVDATNADYHNEVHGPNHHMEVAVWGDGEDFTLVVVSDPATNPANKSMVSTEGNRKAPMFKLYPNPANETSQLELNFEDKAPTSINITDMKGATVAKMELGDFVGQFKHKIDVSKMDKGVYIIQVDHGNEKIMEKLIVE